MSGPAPSADDELGHTILYCEQDTDKIPVSSFFQQDEALLADVLRRSHDLFCDSTDTGAESDIRCQAAALDRDRRVYLDTAGGILRSFSSVHVFGSDPALHLDYAPWIRYIIQTEDNINAAVSQSQPAVQGRMTRNSQRTVRWLGLREDERRILAETRLSQEMINAS